MENINEERMKKKRGKNLVDNMNEERVAKKKWGFSEKYGLTEDGKQRDEDLVGNLNGAKIVAKEERIL